MKHFTIENETNNITVYGSPKEADAAPNSERFGTEAALSKLAGDWPMSRLVEIWNGLPGVNPVAKFKDRATAVSRIWKAIQNLGQAAPSAGEEPGPVSETAPVSVVPETTPVAEQESSEMAQPETVSAASTEAPFSTTVAAQAPEVASVEPAAKKKTARTKKALVAARGEDTGAPREGRKTSQVIAMLKRPGGTTLEEIMTSMGWLKHTTRAMLSAGGPLTKKHGLVVISEKVGETRRYYIKG
jgi:hypothetical protein